MIPQPPGYSQVRYQAPDPSANRSSYGPDGRIYDTVDFVEPQHARSKDSSSNSDSSDSDSEKKTAATSNSRAGSGPSSHTLNRQDSNKSLYAKVGNVQPSLSGNLPKVEDPYAKVGDVQTCTKQS